MNPLNKKASPKGGWRLEILILREGVEAGTVLVDVGEITVSEDDGIGIIGLQRAEQGHEGRLLFPGTGVGRDALGRQPTFIAHTDGVLVVVAGMCPRQVLVPRLVQLSIAGDVVVIASEPEAGIVAGNEVLYGEPTVSARG